MPTPEAVIRVVREWLRKADNDLEAAAHTLTLGKECSTETVCFHAQQCIEKHVQALLVFRATAFSRTHDIHELRALLPPKLRPRLDRKVQRRLTEYAAVLRYPESGPDIPSSEARRAVRSRDGSARRYDYISPERPCAARESNANFGWRKASREKEGINCLATVCRPGNKLRTSR